MNAIKRNIPNAITCLNLLCGCIALVFLFSGQLEHAAWMVVFAAIADFFDGMAARLLHVSSPIGKELDSLADMVSFGVVPGMAIYQLINNHPYNWIGFCVPIFAAIRLAKFNIDTRQTTYFRGVPTPAISLFIISFLLILSHDDYWASVYSSNANFVCWFFSAIAIICSALMVAPLNFMAMKVKDLSWTNNKARYILLILSIASIILFHFASVPIIFGLYILLSLFANPAKESHE